MEQSKTINEVIPFYPKDTVIERKKGGKSYQFHLAKFSKEFKNIATLLCVHVNDQNKVYAAEWLDNEGIHNFNSGFVPDVHFTVKFVD